MIQRPMFLEKGEQFKLSEAEEKVLAFWEKEQIFEKSLKKRKGKKPFVFYEGPPTANGRPGIHHVIARVFKDIIPRYQTMRGRYVERKGGWDTHGLPVEIQVEKELGLRSKKEIEEYGVAAFNAKCRESVWKFKEEFERLTKRMGYWVDTKHPYITYENSYIESIWWILKEIHDRGYLVKGHKIVPWCPRCGTALSSHELAQGYETVKDNSVYVKFKFKPGQKVNNFELGDNTYILSWTTTPWTLPGNVALAVHPHTRYVIAESEDGKERIIIAEDIYEAGLSQFLPDPSNGSRDMTASKYVANSPWPKVQSICSGLDLQLAGIAYEPLFNIPALKNENAYKIYAADFVTTTDGTGVVHTAVMYGADDYELGKKVGLPQYHTVDEAGRFTNDVSELKGQKAKDPETEKNIFAHLEKHGNLLRVEKYEHEYPTCWRCHTPILYYARGAWFIEMSRLKKELLASNEKINWVPEHLKEGRFGEWLREIKDWNLSRERYWATPLPVWQCEECEHKKVIGGGEELAKEAKLPELIFVRHGEAEHNIKKILISPNEKESDFIPHLTKKGKRQIEELSKKLKNKKIDRIICSPLARIIETANILRETIEVPMEVNEDLRDLNPGNLVGQPEKKFYSYLDQSGDIFNTVVPGGESRNQVMARMVGVWKEIVKKYPGERILVLSHGDPMWMLKRALEGVSDDDAKKLAYPKTGQVYEIETKFVSFDEEGRPDFHRPFIDAVKLSCEKCEGEMVRVPEVIDVWFDSGAMPFAQWHYPFENEEKIKKGTMFPADYICEAIDQTRGWFYTLLAISVLLGKGRPYKNVISLGHINDKHGKKMSKSLGNIVDPWSMADTYGMDAVRWYFFTATPPGEPKNFDEEEVKKAARRFHLIFWNSFVFYDTYTARKRNPAKALNKKKNILDQWIIARLSETREVVTRGLDRYDVREAGLALESFLDDFSRWYIRRSRRRLQKPISKADYETASETFGQVLHTLTLLTAPFTPFFSEFLYHQLMPKKNKDSVHLLDWPKESKKLINKKLLSEMAEVRRLAAVVLARRAELGLKVRQPLAILKIKESKTRIKNKELLEILKDEVNVKEIIYDKKIKEEIWLDTTITEELKEEGIIRELIRNIQELRQEAGCSAKDKIILSFGETDLKESILRNKALLLKEVGAKEIWFGKKGKSRASKQITILESQVEVHLL